jgi:signal transduction histidine kinase
VNVLISAQIVVLNQEELLLAEIVDITERKRAEEQLQALSRQLLEAQEQERRAIGRELHDEIGQTLTGLKILLEVAQRLPTAESHRKLEQAQEAAGELIDRVGALSLDLRPPMLDDLGLLPALLWFVDRYSTRTNIQVEFHHAGIVDRRLAPALETAAYRLAQEALTNVARHAGVDKVAVWISAREAELDLRVEDAGRGFEAQPVLERQETGGLSGMHERVRLLSGELEIDSAPGQGTRVFIRLPLDQEP